MQRLIKFFLVILVLAMGLQVSQAFSLLGPVGTGGDGWQVNANGYNPINNGNAPPYLIDDLPVGPKNLGEEYRYNAPYIYYTCDANFLDYFGSNGLAAVDGTFAILNFAFTNSPTGRTNGVDGYSTALTEFPLQTMSPNYSAQTLGLLDVQSTTLMLMMEQLGLADSVRYTWVIHNYFQPANTTCPNNSQYIVAMRNFDILTSPLNQVQYSPYVNGVFWSYQIIENCSAPVITPPNRDAVEFSPDPLANNPPVASGGGVDLLDVGYFYTGLTRDDMAGLRYLLSSNNINTETPASGSLLMETNNPTTIVTTSDIGALVTSGMTNDPATLAALFPGVVASSTAYWTNVLTPNVVIYFTNYAGDPVGSAPRVIIVTNGYTISTVQNYVTSFGNVVTNSYRSNSTAILLTTKFGAPNGAPIGTPFDFSYETKKITLTNVPTGDYFVIPDGSCGMDVIKVWQTNVIYTTNLLGFSINPDGSFTTLDLVTYYTNHVLEVRPCNYVIPTPGLYQGIQKVQFARANYDSLLGQLFQPITNTYSMILVTNSQRVRQNFQRVVTSPDILMTAVDFAPGPNQGSAIFPVPNRRTLPGFTMDAAAYPGLAGPGVINPPVQFTYNKVGPVLENIGTAYLTLNNIRGRSFVWGSFDGTTNAPVVYPNGTSIANLTDSIFVQISVTPTNAVNNTVGPPQLINGTAGTAYGPITFSATGGAFSPPFTWDSSNLPNGLVLSPGGALSGTPAQAGTFDFIVQLTDSNSRKVQWVYRVTIN